MIRKQLTGLLPVLLFSILGFLVMGYHPGMEDDGVYLAAIKADLNPTLFSHDADFFRLQLQATCFDVWMARFVGISGISLGWAILLIQFISLLTVLWALFKISCLIFDSAEARWAGVAMSAAMFTLPVAGTAIYIADQHLHPRNIATALVLLAIERIMKRRNWQAVILLAVAMLCHPIMGAMGWSFSLFLFLAHMEKLPNWARPGAAVVPAFVPLGWIFSPPNPTWRQALETQGYYFLKRWEWYELLGAYAPLIIFAVIWFLARRAGREKLARLSLAVLGFGVFQFVVALVMTLPPAFIRLLPLQPMRFLQLVYIFLVLIAGAMIGEFLLKRSWWRWALYLVIINAGMYIGQVALFPASEHVEWPGAESKNPWLQAFSWIRLNTPVDAYFALDPRYLDAAKEDYHCFRPLAERSVLADAFKDTAVVTQVPQLGPIWAKQQEAQKHWKKLRIADFERLHDQFGVDWVLVYNDQNDGLDCRYHNDLLSVCKVGGSKQQ